MEDECPHGMDSPDWCSVCRHGPRSTDAITYGDWSFPALFDGQCCECNLPIHPGEAIARREKGEQALWVHWDCKP